MARWSSIRNTGRCCNCRVTSAKTFASGSPNPVWPSPINWKCTVSKWAAMVAAVAAATSTRDTQFKYIIASCIQYRKINVFFLKEITSIQQQKTDKMYMNGCFYFCNFFFLPVINSRSSGRADEQDSFSLRSLVEYKTSWKLDGAMSMGMEFSTAADSNAPCSEEQ